MSDGYQKQRLTNYLNGASEGAIGSAGTDWKAKGALLQAVSEALQKKGPELAEKLGKDSQTAAGLKSSLLTAAGSMSDTADKLSQAGAALMIVGDNLEKARVQRTAMKSLIEPPPYSAPSYNGAQPTPEQIEQEATKRAAANQQHSSYQTAYSGQEAEAAQITTKLDEAFLSAIPPMMAIHGGPDPTAPTPGPGGPGGPTGPTTPTTPAIPRDPRDPTDPTDPRDPRDPRDPLDPVDPVDIGCNLHVPRDPEVGPTDPVRPPKDPVHVPTTNVQGGTDGGTSYHGTNAGGPTSVGSAGSTSAGVAGAAAAGAAGAGLGAGMMKGGSISGAVRAPSSGSVRGIGAGGRPGAPGSLTRGTTAAGSTARGASAGARSASSAGAARTTGAGSASRSAGAGGRAGAAGASGAKTGAAKGGAGRTGAAGSTSGKSSAKSKGKGLFRRGSNGSTAGGRSSKLDDERNTQRDALVYEQDWLGEDATAPSVLD